MHTGGEAFTCNLCEKSFNEKPDLKKHIRIHSGKKPYACDQCPERFNQTSTLSTDNVEK